MSEHPFDLFLKREIFSAGKPYRATMMFRGGFQVSGVVDITGSDGIFKLTTDAGVGVGTDVKKRTVDLFFVASAIEWISPLPDDIASEIEELQRGRAPVGALSLEELQRLGLVR